MISWTPVLVAAVLVMGGLFSVLVLFSLSRAASGGDVDWQIARLERKVDLILTHLGIGHDDHVPGEVVALVREGRTEDAVEEYRLRTGSRLAAARREIAYLRERLQKTSAWRSDEV